MADLFSKFDSLIQQRETLLESGVTDPFNLVMEKVESPTVAICNGKRTILLGTYNYMGMTFDPDVVAAGKQALDDFLDSLSWTDIFDLGGVWERAKRIFTEPVGRLIDFAVSTAVELLKMIKDAILKPLAAMAWLWVLAPACSTWNVDNRTAC